MKQGDTVPVTISGQVVAQATVKETGEGTVTLVVPATLVVMATRTSIDTVATVPEGQRTPEVPVETIITGVDRASGSVSGDLVAPERVPSAADAPVGTPEVVAPTVTDPGEPLPPEVDRPTNNGSTVTPVPPVETVSETVADKPADKE